MIWASHRKSLGSIVPEIFSVNGIYFLVVMFQLKYYFELGESVNQISYNLVFKLKRL